MVRQDERAVLRHSIIPPLSLSEWVLSEDDIAADSCMSANQFRIEPRFIGSSLMGSFVALHLSAPWLFIFDIQAFGVLRFSSVQHAQNENRTSPRLSVRIGLFQAYVRSCHYCAWYYPSGGQSVAHGIRPNRYFCVPSWNRIFQLQVNHLIAGVRSLFNSVNSFNINDVFWQSVP